MKTITLQQIEAAEPCRDGFNKLLAYLRKSEADETEVSLETILNSNGLKDALWCLQFWPEHDREWRLFAVWCARQEQHLMVNERSIKALDVAERYANGEATVSELDSARVGAWAAWTAARAATKDVRAAAWAAARAATRDARVAAWAAWDAAEAAAEAACAATSAATRGKQEKEFRRILRSLR